MKNTFKFLLFLGFTIFSFFLTAQTAPDEDTNPDLTCPSSGEFANATRTSSDYPNPVNLGTIDDRTCYADYSESNVNGSEWGNYNITFNSNHLDSNGLQPRMERSLSRSQETGVGSFARFTGTFRILEVGDAGVFSQDGSYIAQAKGKHTGGGGSADPAICLYLAKPVYGTGANTNNQVAFDIYAERILYRGGEGSGREVVFLQRVNKNDEISFELEVGFREDPNDAAKKNHYCDAVIGGVAFNWNIPEPNRGVESGIRYGAYRVKGGRAQIRWANTTYQKEEIVDTGNPPDPTQEIFSVKNVATGKFLTDAGVSATAVTMSDSDDGENTHWTFVESGAYYNIDSETYGILRAPGAGGPGGAYVVVSTGTNSPSTDTDKIWTIHYNESDATYRYESGNSGRFLYHEVNGTVTHIVAPETDERSKWQAISQSALSVSDAALRASSIKVYPNPAEDKFTIAFQNINNIKSIEIYNILGKRVYQNTPSTNTLEIENATLKTGVYLVKAFSDNNKVFHSKLIIK